MDELTYNFSLALHKELTRFFRGSVYITGTQEDLEISIRTKYFERKYHCNDVIYKVQHGMTAKYLAEKILKDFKSDVLKSVFKKIPV